MVHENVSFNDLPRLMADILLQMQKMSVKIDNLEKRTVMMVTENNPHRPLTTEQVSRLVHRKRDTVYKLARAGEIPCYRKGKFLEFFEDEVINWLSQSPRVSPQAIISQAANYCNEHPL